MRFGTFSYNQARPTASEEQLFCELIDQTVLSEQLGFDEAWFAEHHHSDYGLIASPNLIIAALATRTTRLRLGGLVNVLPLHDPMRLAEESAILDLLTGGRLNVGIGRGVPRDDIKHGIDADTARAQFEEAATLLERAWTEPVFSHEGQFWRYADISCRPRPLQQPHPPIYYGVTSLESAPMVARRNWNLGLSRQPIEAAAKLTELYRDTRREMGATPGDVVLVRDVYVADTDEQAWAEAGPEITRFWQLGTDNVWSHDPITPDDLPRFTKRFAYFPGGNGLTLETTDSLGVSLVGSPESVTRKAQAMIDRAHPDSLVGLFSFGGLTHAQITHSMELFATKVIPNLSA